MDVVKTVTLRAVFGLADTVSRIQCSPKRIHDAYSLTDTIHQAYLPSDTFSLPLCCPGDRAPCDVLPAACSRFRLSLLRIALCVCVASS